MNDQNNEMAVLRGAVENTNEAFVTIDENHRVIFFNRAAEKIFGYSREEVIGKDLNAILPPGCSKDHREAVNRYLQTRKARVIGHETEMTTLRKNGEEFPISISFSVAEVQDRLFFTGIIRDLTETKALEEQVSRGERLAALGQIVAEITHEIKNPLVIIGSYAQQVLRTAQDEKSRRRLQIITDEVKRLEKLLAEFNEYYLPRKLQLSVLDLNQLLQEVCSLARQQCEEKNIRLECRIPARPALVEGDGDKLKQVFLNAVRNGIEAMGKDGSLLVQSGNGDRAEVRITDSGPGIPQKYMDKIFDPFFTTKSGGTGLGLAVSKRIMENHPHSSIEVISQEGKGTTVKITMPFYRAEGRK